MPVVARLSEPSCGSRRAVGVALVAVCCAVVVAACGGSSPNTAAGSDSGTSPQFGLARCMRAHSVPNFPDPTLGAGGEGFSIAKSPGSSSVTVDGISFSGPAFRAATKTCQFAGALGPSAGTSGTQKEAFIAMAHCIRTHGVPNFPDPFFGPGGHGVGLNLPPGINRQSPAFLSAAKACAQVGAAIPGLPG
jgi:hypothetical protein